MDDLDRTHRYTSMYRNWSPKKERADITNNALAAWNMIGHGWQRVDVYKNVVSAGGRIEKKRYLSLNRQADVANVGARISTLAKQEISREKGASRIK